MPTIQNISKKQALCGEHINAQVYIQIVDDDMLPYGVHYDFHEMYVFSFLDVGLDKPDNCISDEDAKSIHSILQRAYDNGYNVVVSCVAGQNRSGSVAKCANAIGFDAPYTNFSFGNEAVDVKLMRLIHRYVNE